MTEKAETLTKTINGLKEGEFVRIYDGTTRHTFSNGSHGLMYTNHFTFTVVGDVITDGDACIAALRPLMSGKQRMLPISADGITVKRYRMKDGAEIEVTE